MTKYIVDMYKQLWSWVREGKPQQHPITFNNKTFYLFEQHRHREKRGFWHVCNKNQLELNTHPEFACLLYQHPISIVHFHTLLGRYTKERCRRDAENICNCLTDPFFEERADCEVEKWKIQNPQVIIQSKVDA